MSGKTIASVLQNVILPVVTVGTATMVAWLNYSVSRVDQGLKEQIAAVDIAIKEANCFGSSLFQTAQRDVIRATFN